MGSTVPCWVERCTERAAARGLCEWHYQRYHRYKDAAALAGPRPPRPECVMCGRTLRGLNAKRCMACRPVRQFERDWVNPLICDCEEPDADPARDFGMCQRCKRKPLELMAVAAS